MRNYVSCGFFISAIMLLVQPYQSRGAYGDYSSARPAWLDQSLTSAGGDFVIWYSDDTHHSTPYAGGADADGDGLPDDWETHYLGGTGGGANGDSDGDGSGSLAEFQAGSWPNENYFRPADTIPSTVNAGGENIIARDVVDTLLFCQDRYAAWGFNAPWGLPLGVFIRNTYAGGWGNV
ncbi:MAG: hypothetical protein M1608_11390, partial [Candidatus Omnitrophica bacterium]|nr:hypothetical protein [Candidatus Omnitrophota bacterium]